MSRMEIATTGRLTSKSFHEFRREFKINLPPDLVVQYLADAVCSVKKSSRAAIESTAVRATCVLVASFVVMKRYNPAKSSRYRPAMMASPRQCKNSSRVALTIADPEFLNIVAFLIELVFNEKSAKWTTDSSPAVYCWDGSINGN